MAKTNQEKETALRCICGRVPCTVKHRSRYMLSCPAQNICAMRSRWKGTEQDAVKDWNNAVQAARHQRGGKSWRRIICNWSRAHFVAARQG